jgi:glycosyltransferase involved in cell wall biosynthesis
MGRLDPRLGGPASMLISLTGAQARLGHDVHILTSHEGDNEQRLRQAGALVPGFGLVKIHYLPPLTRTESLLGRRAGAWVREHISSYDAVHTHGVWESISSAAGAVAKAAGKPYFVTPHGMLDAWALARKAWKKRLALALGKRGFVRGAAAMHVLSIHERDCVLAGRFHHQPVIIPNGVFLEQVDPLPAPGTFRRARPELGDDPFIFFLARLHPGKGLDLLTDAFATLLPSMPSLRLVIAGPDSGALAALQAQIARLGVSERVHLIGPIWDQGKFAALVDCAAFALPSQHEAFSMSIAEALACGAPVVITRECHLPEVQEVGAGMVTERTVPAITDALARVLRDPRARQTMGPAGRRLIEERFTWPRIAQRTVDMYRAALIAGHGGGSRA